MYSLRIFFSNLKFETERIRVVTKQSSLPPNFVFDFSPPNSTHTSTINLREEEGIVIEEEEDEENEDENKANSLEGKTLTNNIKKHQKKIPNIIMINKNSQQQQQQQQNHSNLNIHNKKNDQSNQTSSNEFIQLQKPIAKTLLERRGFKLAKQVNATTGNDEENQHSKASSILDLTSDLDSVDKMSVGFIIKRNKLKEEKIKVVNGSKSSKKGARSDSINNESDNISAIMKLRKAQAQSNNAIKSTSILKKITTSNFKEFENSVTTPESAASTSKPPPSTVFTLKNKNHFSPQSSVRIRVIDETDTDN